MEWLDKIPLWLLVVLSLTLGLAPFYPEPHLWEKLKMLVKGNLTRPVDIVDFVYHAAAPVIAPLLAAIARRVAGGHYVRAACWTPSRGWPDHAGIVEGFLRCSDFRNRRTLGAIAFDSTKSG